MTLSGEQTIAKHKLQPILRTAVHKFGEKIDRKSKHLNGSNYIVVQSILIFFVVRKS